MAQRKHVILRLWQDAINKEIDAPMEMSMFKILTEEEFAIRQG